MSTSENIDPTSILSTSVNHELLRYPILPNLPPLPSAIEQWLITSALPARVSESISLTSTPANISRKRTPLVQCLSQSPARPGRASQVQGIFGSAHQERLQRVATPMRLDTSERRVGRGTAGREHGEDPKSRRFDLATFTPSSARRICGKVIPRVGETALEIERRREASQRNHRLTSQPLPSLVMPKRAKNESKLQATKTTTHLKDPASAASNNSSTGGTASISSLQNSPATRKASTSSDEQDPRLERAIAASLSSTPSRSERRRELSLNTHLQQSNLAPKLPLAFRSTSSEEWTDDDLFFPAKASTSGPRDATFDASPSTPRKPRTPTRLVLRSADDDVLAPYLPVTPKQRASRFQSPKATRGKYF